MSYTTVWGTIRLGWKKVEKSEEKSGRKIIFHAELPGAAVAEFVYGEKGQSGRVAFMRWKFRVKNI